MAAQLASCLLSTVLLLNAHDRHLAECAELDPNKFHSEMTTISHFKPVLGRALQVAPLESRAVSDALDCTFLCSQESRCVSFNLQTAPSDGSPLRRCDLLDTDMFRARGQLHGNATFNHYAMKVRAALVSRFSSLLFQLTLVIWLTSAVNSL